MPSLDELEAGLARLTATYKTLTVTFDYHPDRVGMNMQRAIAAVSRPPHDMGPIADELAHVLSAWDLTRSGSPIPITADGIGSLGMALSSAIGAAIMEDFHDPKSPRSMAPSSALPTDSPPGSKPDASATALTGPISSSEQNGPGSIQPTLPASPIPVGA
jgi:hypothetical protein